ncbi:MAG TPA: hypothetical protein QGG70_00770 [Candidatus Pacearchaeota archaeon]|jgi:hypothetical protein|nr:hypothetical protein [Candidatus Pacearchaeota archaeon]
MKLKKGQVSIFIILGILIVVVLLLLFSRDAGFDTIFAKQSPYQEIEGCAQTAIQEGLDILMLQGGVIESENYFMYEGKKIDYVCYSENEYENCIMQKPILTNTIRDELEEYSTPKIKSCLSSVKNDLERKGYSVVMRDPEIVIELVPDNVLVDMNLGLRIEKTGVESFDHIRTGIKSKIYNFALITSSISQWETRYGDSETLNYMLYYPSLKVEKKKQGDGTTVYILTDRDTDEKFYFASRSIAIPAGFIV